MSTNFYFQNGVPGGRVSEQRLVDQLIQESLKIYGFDIYYLPRTQVNYDHLFSEDTISKFEQAIPLEAYLENVDGFGGDGELMQKFGIEIRETASFVISRNRWNDVVGAGRSSILPLPNRPAEGDIIYLPLTNSYLEIKRVDVNNPFYQLGKLYVYRIQCELIQYSSERFDTGIAEIDAIEDERTQDVNQYGILLEDGSHLLLDSLTYNDADQGHLMQEGNYEISNTDPQADNSFMNTAALDILDFSEINPFGEIAIR
jgi:hypothetical protein